MIDYNGAPPSARFSPNETHVIHDHVGLVDDACLMVYTVVENANSCTLDGGASRLRWAGAKYEVKEEPNDEGKTRELRI